MKKTNLLFAFVLGIFLCVLSSCGEVTEYKEPERGERGDYYKINSKKITLSDIDTNSDLYLFIYNTAEPTLSYKEYANIFQADASRTVSSITPVSTEFQNNLYDEFANYTCGLSLKSVRNATTGKSIKRTTIARDANGSEIIYQRDLNKSAAELYDEEDFITQYTDPMSGETVTTVIFATCRAYNDVCQIFVESGFYDSHWQPQYCDYYDDEDNTGKSYSWSKEDEEDKNYHTIRITASGVERLVEEFSAIYDEEQALLGYVDLDFIEGNSNIIETSEKITILVSNLGKRSDSATLGYFYPEDLRCDCGDDGFIDDKETDERYYTNQRQMFTINTIGYADKIGGENAIYSTLAHEFNHMINYINKRIKNNTGYDVWFTEMLSVTAEDFAYRFLGIDNTVQKARIPFFLRYPYSGMINWEGLDISYSYGFAYAFGAYLVRNYGGAKLLNELATNKDSGQEAITQALKKLGYSETYDSILQKFGTIFVNDAGAKDNFPTLNKGFSETFGNFKYHFPAVDLYKFTCKSKNEKPEVFTEKLTNPKWSSEDEDKLYKGPCFYKPANPPEKIYGGGFYASYLGKAGDFGGELKFNPPDEKSGIKAYLFIEY